jgi:hypothetical protein
MTPDLYNFALQCPAEMQQSVKRNVDDFEDYSAPHDGPSEKMLVRLHKRVIAATQTHHRTHAQWNMLMERAFRLEDLAANENNLDHVFKRSFDKADNGFLRKIFTPTVGKFIV